jgi:formylglycine-generating enzyme required for sulfatase activity
MKPEKEKSPPLAAAETDRPPIKDREKLIPKKEPPPETKLKPPTKKPVPAKPDKPVSKRSTIFKRLSLIVIFGIIITLTALHIFKPENGDSRYQEHLDSAKRYLIAGDLINASDSLESAKKIKDTNEVKKLQREIEKKHTKNMKVDFERIKKSMKEGEKKNVKIQEWRDFLDKYKKSPKNPDTDLLKSESAKFITQLEKGIKAEKEYQDHIAYARGYINSGENEKAGESIKKAKNIKETVEVEELTRMTANPFGVQINRKARKIYKNDTGYWEAEFDYGIFMVNIPAGEFTMGSDDGNDNEKPEHKVYLDGYWIGKHEITFEQYDKYCEETGKEKPRDRGWGRGSRPVIYVSWQDATAYCEWLNNKTGLNFKLPTEAQWEKAARGTDGRKYPWGNSPPSGEKLNFADKQEWLKESDSRADRSIDDGYAYTAPVGSYSAGASPYGLLDMAGNVWECCSDWLGKTYYNESPGKNPVGPATGNLRVHRGGTWFSSARRVRSAYRGSAGSPLRWNGAGFRLALGQKGR